MRFLCSLAIVAFVLGACGRDWVETRGSARAEHIEEVVRWGKIIELEENDEVINVSPRVSVDQAGRFLVADMRESQFRIYRPDGRLQRHFGRSGNGPGELRTPISAIRLPSGEILTANISGRYEILDSAGVEIRHEGTLPVSTLFDVDVVNDSILVLAGLTPSFLREPPLVHLWKIDSERHIRSFLMQRALPGLEDETRITSTASIAIRGDTIAALIPHADTLYLFDTRGRKQGAIHIPYRYFRQLHTRFTGRGGEGILDWSQSFSMASDLVWCPDGSFLIQYFDRVKGEVTWRLLHMTRSGRPLFEIRDTPELITASGSTLYFVKPGSVTPNVWTSATFAP